MPEGLLKILLTGLHGYKILTPLVILSYFLLTKYRARLESYCKFTNLSLGIIGTTYLAYWFESFLSAVIPVDEEQLSHLSLEFSLDLAHITFPFLTASILSLLFYLKTFRFSFKLSLLISFILWIPSIGNAILFTQSISINSIWHSVLFYDLLYFWGFAFYITLFYFLGKLLHRVFIQEKVN